MISDANQYMNASEAAKLVPNCLLLRNVARYVTRSLAVFGSPFPSTSSWIVEHP